jgi:hypothetical protein
LINGGSAGGGWREEVAISRCRDNMLLVAVAFVEQTIEELLAALIA